MANNQIDDWQDVPVKDDGADDWQDVTPAAPLEIEEKDRSTVKYLKDAVVGLIQGGVRGVKDVAHMVANPTETIEEFAAWTKDVATDPKGDIEAGGRMVRGIPLVGPVIENAAAQISSIVSDGTPEDYIKALREGDAKHAEESPRAHLVQSLAGPAAAAYIAGPLAAFSPITTAGDAYLRSRNDGTDYDDAGKDAFNAALLAEIANGAPNIRKGAGAAAEPIKRLLPGTENAYDWTNRGAATFAKFVPSQGASADDIYEMLKDTETRRGARNTNFVDKTMKLAPQLDDAKRGVNEAVGKSFSKLENDSLQTHAPARDLRAAKASLEYVDDQLKFIDENSQFYSPVTKKLADDVVVILTSGGPMEVGASSYGKTFMDIMGSDQAASVGNVMRLRNLNARRRIDDLMKSKNWDNLLDEDRKVIQGLRDNINEGLKKKFGGATERAVADKLYSDAVSARDNLMKPLEQLGPDGIRNVEPAKLHNFLKSQGVKGSVFDQSLEAFSKWLKEAEASIGEVPEAHAAIAKLEETRSLGKMAAMMERMNKASGGPTSQAFNTAMQGAAAVGTGGYSLLLFPITNPRGWVEMIDGLGKPVWDSVTKASNAWAQKNPALAAKLYLLSQQQEEQQK
jgi:hypothetical protein